MARMKMNCESSKTSDIAIDNFKVKIKPNTKL